MSYVVIISLVIYIILTLETIRYLLKTRKELKRTQEIIEVDLKMIRDLREWMDTRNLLFTFRLPNEYKEFFIISRDEESAISIYKKVFETEDPIKLLFMGQAKPDIDTGCYTIINGELQKL